jgi:hypothetical protein
MQKSKPETTGQAQPRGAEPKKDQDAAPKTGAQPRAQQDQKQQPSAQQNQRSPGAAAQQPSDKSSPTTGQAARPAGGAVTLTTEQKTKLRTTVVAKAPKVTNVNFSISVGTVVPRSVRLVAVPPTLIEIHPAWRGYQYFVYADEIIIVEPRTLKIVAVLHV